MANDLGVVMPILQSLKSGHYSNLKTRLSHMTIHPSLPDVRRERGIVDALASCGHGPPRAGIHPPSLNAYNAGSYSLAS
ncbi:MAG: hypothetical protein ACYC2D_02325 [Thiobacillus sp.]